MPAEVHAVKDKGYDFSKNKKGYLQAKFDYGIVMVYIPAGEFTMGSDDGDKDAFENEKPENRIYLDGYWIGKYEVTYEQYDKYCEEEDKEKPGDQGWGRGNRPVINVSWVEAAAYCGWLSKKTGLNFKLPTEAQWEKAARGTKGLIYPWGNKFVKNICNSYESGLGKTIPVGEFSAGVSPYGCIDMAGNVWEWCSDRYSKFIRNNKGQFKRSLRVVRGGSWINVARLVRCACIYGFDPLGHVSFLGFRLCLDIK
jgi:formylglycine-generating enzyme required for sulfatase activity